MPPITKHTPTSFQTLKARVDQMRTDGFVVSHGFREPGGSSIAVPVWDQAGNVVACVNLSGPDSGFDFDKLESFYLPETKATALRISRELGYEGPN